MKLVGMGGRGILRTTCDWRLASGEIDRAEYEEKRRLLITEDDL
jgi:hypothetical protein